MQRLQGRVAVVTGSGAGIGRAIAELFAAEGAHLWINDIDGASAEATAAALTARGLGASALAVDVARAEDVGRLFAAVAKAHGRIDVLVNNAGLNVRADFRNLKDEDWLKIRQVNLDGVIRIARDGFPLLQASGDAALINLASIMAHRGQRQLAAYSATKGAVSALTRTLAVEYAPFGIRVNALAPGFIETQLTKQVLRVPLISKALIEQTPLRRFGTGEDVARAALFLASAESSFITGVEIPVDGGMMARL